MWWSLIKLGINQMVGRVVLLTVVVLLIAASGTLALAELPLPSHASDPPPELYSEDDKEQTEREKQIMPKRYFDDSELPPCPDESSVRMVTVDETGVATGKTLSMTSYRVSAFEQRPDEWSAPYSGTSQGQTYIGSPFASAPNPAPPALAPAHTIPDVANILKTLSSLTGMQAGIPAMPPPPQQQQQPMAQAPPPQAYAPPAADIGSLLANLGPAMGQMPAQPWQQYQQPQMMPHMNGPQGFQAPGDGGWASRGAVDQDMNGMGRGGNFAARGGRGGGRGGGYQAGPAPPPGSGSRVCRFFSKGGK